MHFKMSYHSQEHDHIKLHLTNFVEIFNKIGHFTFSYYNEISFLMQDVATRFILGFMVVLKQFIADSIQTKSQ
jgi:hypothetical protein